MEEDALKIASLLQSFQDLHQRLDLSFTSNFSLTIKIDELLGKQEELCKSKSELEVKVEDLSSELAEVKKALELANTKVDGLSAEMEAFLKSMAEKDVQFQKFQADFEEARTVIINADVESFANAIAQARVLNPGLITEGMDVSYGVKDGSIIPGTLGSESPEEEETEAEGSSQIAASLPSLAFLLPMSALLNTKSPFWNDRGWLSDLYWGHNLTSICQLEGSFLCGGLGTRSKADIETYLTDKASLRKPLKEKSREKSAKHIEKTYIVYMGDHPKDMDSTSLPFLHMDMAQKILGSDFAPEAILHSYKSFNGFVMKLTEEEAERMAEMDTVVSVFPNKKNRLHTTRSWDFLGFPQQVKRTSIESDIIVGVLDYGIWPESESFSDKGFGPPPSKWKGSCHNFTCNNKVIGAKFFNIESYYTKEDIKSPRDTEGHGSHCASTIAGNLVNHASLLGFASGTARGGVPSARIAVYKICWKSGCSEADTLAAFDEAIIDGVDLISTSTGADVIVYPEYFEDAINIGSFHAMKRGILRSNSANNLGPELYSMTNYPPWLLSVAATTINRKFVTKLQLGNGMVYEGVSMNTFDLKSKMFPLIVSSGFLSGAVGVIVGATGQKDRTTAFALPATVLTTNDFRLVNSYIDLAGKNATATIFRSDEVNNSLAPYVASFSSRGPNPITPNILKPDLAAPGVNIIAAYSPMSPISHVQGDKRLVKYNVISGTSMACPHAAGAAVYVKSFHPNWSAAMIKSALMTTATPMSVALNPEAEFAYGAGQINPLKAANPGLVYDISEADYVKFLCGEGYTNEKLRVLTQDHAKCSKKPNKLVVYNLNLPSFALKVNASFYRVFHRTVTNVGSATSSYKAQLMFPSFLDIQVKPDVLSFTSIGQKKSFSVIIVGKINVETTSASLVWDDGNYQVRSPVVIYSDP
ncbi:cucumisin-like [Gastrolobium bilobum]|uniref:cucumisin-like n=1 Tax=Gastrolobium bilobum TaxID=150636 RepID=UPI002AB0B54D|nr:cucumisin-like [Gastrolobium bilobum]